MRDGKQARVLVQVAKRDLSALRGMDDSHVFADQVFGFHAQQAAEKLLKAWLALLGEVYPLTHDLEVLLDRLQEREVSVDHLRPLVEYTGYARNIRYGSDELISKPLDRTDAARRIEAPLEEVARQLTAHDG